MAARNVQKAGAVKAAKPTRRPRAAPRGRSAIGEGSVAAGGVERERDALKEELRLAREEIARLKRQHEEAVNHIDWVIDSLHSLLEGES